MQKITRRSFLGYCLAAVLISVAVLMEYENKETVEVLIEPSQSLLLSSTVQPTLLQTTQPTHLTFLKTDHPIVQTTPTIFVLGPLFNSEISLRVEPLEVPFELQIPELKVNAPVLGVGLTLENEMDAPKGPIDDPVWHTAFWYRGGSIPGDIGTATIAGHVNDPLGRPEIFADLGDLEPGDLIIIHDKKSNNDIEFSVDEVVVYSVQESSNPAVLRRIFGVGSADSSGSSSTLDGLSYLTLMTCAGQIVNGEFDHHLVVYATRSN